MSNKDSGYSFLATVISGAIVGFAFDKLFNTQPWGMICFIVIGFAYAVFKAQRAESLNEMKDAQQKDDKKL